MCARLHTAHQATGARLWGPLETHFFGHLAGWMTQNNVLVLGAPHSGKLRAAALVGADLATAVGSQESHSGLIFKVNRRTRYFGLDLRLMVDEYLDEQQKAVDLPPLEQWAAEFMSDDMADLRTALDGMVFCLNVDAQCSHADTQAAVGVVEQLRELLGGLEWPGFIAVAGVGGVQDPEKHDIVEDMATLAGLEYINMEQQGENEFRDKLGRDRLVELFDTHEWSSMEREDNEGFESRKMGKGGEMTRGLLDEETGEEKADVEEFQRIINKLKAARLAAEDMDEAEKEAYARLVMEDVLLYL